MPHELPETNPLLTPREVAEIFGVRTTTIARWAREGTLTPLRTPGGHRRFRREDIQHLLAKEPPPDEAEQRLAEDAARLYSQGWSVRQVAERFDRSYGAMHRILRRHVTLRGPGGTNA